MSRPFILVSLANNGKTLVRMGAEGGAVDVYRLYLGRWNKDALTRGVTQVEYDAKTNAVTLTHNGLTSSGVKTDPRDARRLLKMFPAPWVVEAEAWDATDEANNQDDDAAKDLQYQRVEQRELKGE